MQDLWQFYPTPPALAAKAWAMFEKAPIERVLEPSAGRGHLLAPLKDRFRHDIPKVDTLEINVAHHAQLRSEGYRVIDTDFLNFHSPVGYTHIILNPPFNQGVDHVLHAWDILRNGQLVAIINAQSIENPCDAKRRHLVSLIEQHGRVEYVDSAFEDPDTLRKTSVRIALVHLIKTTRYTIDPRKYLAEDQERPVDDSGINLPMLPATAIQNVVRAFNAAVKAMEASVRAAAEANYYRGLIQVKQPGDAVPGTDAPEASANALPEITFDSMRDAINTQYEELKEQAWCKVLATTEFTRRFSSRVRNEIQAQIDTLTEMEFTVQNVYALLGGLIDNKTELDYQMLEEIFDTITQYHSDNRWHYRPYKSNEKHRLGFRIRTTRFILPHMKESFGDNLGYRAKDQLRDIDRAFALLDGKLEPNFGMLDAASDDPEGLRSAQRLTSDYFDIRFYKGIGTLHVFPRRKDLVERLNRVVGQRRQWMPDRPADAPDTFWSQYDRASEIEKATANALGPRPPWARISDQERFEAHAKACDALGITLPLAFDDGGQVEDLLEFA